MFKKKMSSIVVGTFAVMLLGGCGGASASPDVDIVVSPVISQERPAQDARIALDPFADFEVVYFEDKGSLPVILGGKDILQTNTGGENYGLSNEEKEAELAKQEADRNRYGERVICLMTGCSPKLSMKVIDTHEKKLPVTYVIHHLAKGRTNANEEDGGEVAVEARLEGEDKNRYRLEKDSRNVKIEGVSRYVAYDPERPEEIEKIWKALKASHEEQPVTLLMGVPLDEWEAYTDTEAFLSETYPELEIRSWEAVTPIGVIVRCDVKNWAKGSVNLEDHYAVLDFFKAHQSIIERADGDVIVDRRPVSEGGAGYSLCLFSTEEKLSAYMAKRNINQDYILKIKT